MWMRKSIVMFCAVLICSKTLRAETTFLANYNRSDLTGNARFMPDYQIGGGAAVSVSGTAAEETVDLPAGSAPILNTEIRVHSGPAALDLRGGRDGLYYTNLAAGNVNRAEGTAEGFFRTPYSLAGNAEPRALFSARVVYVSGARWFWQLDVEGDRVIARLGDNSRGGGSVTLESLPFSEGGWLANVWHHVALTWKAGGMVQLFVNGKLAGRASAAALSLSPAVEAGDGNRIYIGMRSAGTGGLNADQGANLEGWVDSVRFDNTVLFDGTGRAVGEPVFTPPVVESGRSLVVFSALSTVWQSSGGLPAMQKVFDHRTKGYEFTCDFAKVAERCFWDAEMNLDLSSAASLSGWFYVTNAAAILSVNIHFRSGRGWYNAMIGSLADGWNNFGFNLNAAGIEGTPAGWNQIDLVRVSFWKRPFRQDQIAAALYDVESSLQTAEWRPFEYPEYDIEPASIRQVKRDPVTFKLLESRVIFDEGSLYLCCHKRFTGIPSVLDAIEAAGFNAYMVNVWHGAGARYHSSVGTPVDVSMQAFRDTSDPLADLIREAHVRSIEVHAWFTVGLRQADLYPEFAEPGTPAEAFDLQNPRFRDFIVREIVEFAKKYDVDGINLDYIRTQGTSFSPTAARLYLQKYGVRIDELKQNPMPPPVRARFLEWQRDAVSDIVRRISQGIRQVKPKLLISVDGQPYEKPLLHEEGRNEWLWVENGWVDLVYAMEYAPVPDLARLAAVRRSSTRPERFVMLLGNVDRTDQGEIIPREGAHVARLIEYSARKFPGSGAGLYLLSMFSEEQAGALKSGPFKEKAVPYWGGGKAIPSPPKSVRILE